MKDFQDFLEENLANGGYDTLKHNTSLILKCNPNDIDKDKFDVAAAASVALLQNYHEWINS